MADRQFTVKYLKGDKTEHGVFKYTYLKNGETLIEYIDKEDDLKVVDCHSFHAFNRMADELYAQGKILLIKGCRKDVYSQRPIGVYAFQYTIGQRIDTDQDKVFIFDEETDLSTLARLEERKQHYNQWLKSIMGIPYKEYFEIIYKYPAAKLPFPLTRERIPLNLRSLTAYVEYFVSQDQRERERFLQEAPAKAFEDLKEALAPYDKQLDDWLAGPEADMRPPTPEYVAFSLLRMMADGHTM